VDVVEDVVEVVDHRVHEDVHRDERERDHRHQATIVPLLQGLAFVHMLHVAPPVIRSVAAAWYRHRQRRYPQAYIFCKAVNSSRLRLPFLSASTIEAWAAVGCLASSSLDRPPTLFASSAANVLATPSDATGAVAGACPLAPCARDWDCGEAKSFPVANARTNTRRESWFMDELRRGIERNVRSRCAPARDAYDVARKKRRCAPSAGRWPPPKQSSGSWPG